MDLQHIKLNINKNQTSKLLKSSIKDRDNIKNKDSRVKKSNKDSDLTITTYNTLNQNNTLSSNRKTNLTVTEVYPNVIFTKRTSDIFKLDLETVPIVKSTNNIIIKNGKNKNNNPQFHKGKLKESKHAPKQKNHNKSNEESKEESKEHEQISSNCDSDDDSDENADTINAKTIQSDNLHKQKKSSIFCSYKSSSLSPEKELKDFRNLKELKVEKAVKDPNKISEFERIKKSYKEKINLYQKYKSFNTYNSEISNINETYNIFSSTTRVNFNFNSTNNINSNRKEKIREKSIKSLFSPMTNIKGNYFNNKNNINNKYNNTDIFNRVNDGSEYKKLSLNDVNNLTCYSTSSQNINTLNSMNNLNTMNNFSSGNLNSLNTNTNSNLNTLRISNCLNNSREKFNEANHMPKLSYNETSKFISKVIKTCEINRKKVKETNTNKIAKAVKKKVKLIQVKEQRNIEDVKWNLPLKDTVFVNDFDNKIYKEIVKEGKKEAYDKGFFKYNNNKYKKGTKEDNKIGEFIPWENKLSNPVKMTKIIDNFSSDDLYKRRQFIVRSFHFPPSLMNGESDFSQLLSQRKKVVKEKKPKLKKDKFDYVDDTLEYLKLRNRLNLANANYISNEFTNNATAEKATLFDPEKTEEFKLYL